MKSFSRIANSIVFTLALALPLPVMAWQQKEGKQWRSHEFKPVAHTTKAVDYKQGTTSRVDLKGTSSMPDVSGEAEVKPSSGRTEIEVKMDHLKPANSIELNYLTYVLWAISPDGHTANIGELIEKDGKAELKTATTMQAFALLVTAEPYFAVSQPGDQVVAENVIGKGAKGSVTGVDVSFEMIPRDAYVDQAEPMEKPVYGMDKKTPLSLLEARNAVRIAKSANADEFASEPFRNAQQSLSQAEDYYQRKQNSKSIDTVARAAVQSAETARVAALKTEEQVRIDRERDEQAQQTADARTQSQKAQADAQQAQQQAQMAQQQAELEAQRRQNMQTQQQAAAAQAAQAQADANQARQQAQIEAQQRQAAEQQAQNAQQQVAQTRAQMLAQLNSVLETRDTARGLIVSMPDVLFDTGKADLKPVARERLAKVAGILMAYPDIQDEIKGYTNSTGTPSFNQQLSEDRAASVRDYIARQGVPSGSISTHGFGEDSPVASNDTASGRQQNRRVELVVSGQAIGAQMRH